MARRAPDRGSQEKSTKAEGGDPGPVESRVRADLERLITVHPMASSLAEMSLMLARTLDAGAGLAVAAVNRELRANLAELARLGMSDDEDLESDLSTPVRDTPES